MFEARTCFGGGDIRRFHPPSGVFDFVVGGSPCQDFSAARRDEPTGEGEELLREFARVVCEANPRGAVLENVPRVPHLSIAGWERKRIDISDAMANGETLRIRHIQYYYRKGDTWPQIERRRKHQLQGKKYLPAAMASGGKNRNGSWNEMLIKQGLPPNFDLPPFKAVEKYRAVGNGVPVRMGRMIARAIMAMPDRERSLCPVCRGEHLFEELCPFRECACGCDRIVVHPRITASATCRKRSQRRREDSAQPTIYYEPN